MIGYPFSIQSFSPPMATAMLFSPTRLRRLAAVVLLKPDGQIVANEPLPNRNPIMWPICVRGRFSDLGICCAAYS